MTSALKQYLEDRRRLRGAVTAAGLPKAVVLIGSFARGTAVPGLSDLDVLVVDDVPSPFDALVHVVTISPTRLRERIAEGDDFVQWALRYGVPVAGRRWWSAFRESTLETAPWPDPRRKLGQAAARLDVVQDLLAMEDEQAAQCELRFGLALVARAALLLRGVFPLSRPELPDQLDPLGYGVVASRLRRLNDPIPMSSGEITAALGIARSVVEELEARVPPPSPNV